MNTNIFTKRIRDQFVKNLRKLADLIEQDGISDLVVKTTGCTPEDVPELYEMFRMCEYNVNELSHQEIKTVFTNLWKQLKNEIRRKS